MSDFQVGDVVVCVDDSPGRFGGASMSLVSGRTYRVTGCRGRRDGVDGTHILVNNEPDHGKTDAGFWRGWSISRFRKIDAADEQFTQQMRSLKPVKVSSNV